MLLERGRAAARGNTAPMDDASEQILAPGLWSSQQVWLSAA